MKRRILSILILMAMLVSSISPALAQESPGEPAAGDAPVNPNIFLPLISTDNSAAQLAAPPTELPVELPAELPTAPVTEPEDTPSLEDVASPPDQVDAAAPPLSPTDISKVPHYFGPNPNWANSPFTVPDATVTISGDGSGAAAVAAVGANGALTGIAITNPGVGYTTATVGITGAGTGAAATAVVVLSGIVTSIDWTPRALATSAQS